MNRVIPAVSVILLLVIPCAAQMTVEQAQSNLASRMNDPAYVSQLLDQIEKLKHENQKLADELDSVKQQCAQLTNENSFLERELAVYMPHPKAGPSTLPAVTEKSESPHFGAGTAVVSLDHIVIDHVPISRDGTPGQSDGIYIAIWLKIDNSSDSKKIDYETWRGDDSTEGSSLTDEFGNKYKASWSISENPIGGLYSESIYPGKTVYDVVIFEPPVDKARMLQLKLNDRNVGGSGQVHDLMIDLSQANKSGSSR